MAAYFLPSYAILTSSIILYYCFHYERPKLAKQKVVLRGFRVKVESNVITFIQIIVSLPCTDCKDKLSIWPWLQTED